MKLIVELVIAAALAVRRSLRHGLVQALDLPQRLFRPAARHLHGGDLFQRGKHLKFFAEIRRVQLRHHRAHMGQQPHQAFQLQDLQGIAQRGAGNAELAAERGLRQAVAGLPAIGHDVLADIGQDLLVDRLLVHDRRTRFG